jgi:site-specific DNA-methyltransferase (adenine-specific)
MNLTKNFTNRIILGDSLRVLPQLPDESVDLVLTDPPYVVNYRSRDGRKIAGDTDTAWIAPAFRESFRALKPNRFCISFYGWNVADAFLTAWRKAGFKPVGHIVLVKRYASGSRYLRYQHEQAYLLAKGQPVPRWFPLKDVLQWEYTGNRLHPTQKPVSALRPLIGAFSRRGDVVLDPFAGSGSTLVTAADMQRRYIGVEIDRGYWQNARQRLARG